MNYMTKAQKSYINAQTIIIGSKQDEDQLIRYETLLSGAVMDKEIRDCLRNACGTKRKAFHRESAMAENGDIDDLLQ